MAFVPAPNIVEVQFRYTLDGERAMNRIHVNVGATPSSGTIGPLLAECADWWDGNVKTLVPPEMALREVYGKSLEEAAAPEGTVSAGMPILGTFSGNLLPNNVSLAVSLRSGFTGRSSRGRWFWCGLSESQVTGSLVAGGTVSSIDAALTNLKSLIDGLGHTWVVVSYRENNAPRVGGPIYNVVETITIVDSIVDSQRRRLPGRGQ